MRFFFFFFKCRYFSAMHKSQSLCFLMYISLTSSNQIRFSLTLSMKGNCFFLPLPSEPCLYFYLLIFFFHLLRIVSVFLFFTNFTPESMKMRLQDQCKVFNYYLVRRECFVVLYCALRKLIE